jgi:Ca2+ transporting ATPase
VNTASTTAVELSLSFFQFVTIDDGPSPVREFLVEGSTFAPIGAITTADGKYAEKGIVRTAPVDRLVEICSICNDAKIAYNEVSR